MALKELKCFNCGANISRETLKCEYCGANYVFSVDGNLTYQAVISCPSCGQELSTDSTVCLSCGKILTRDEKAIKKAKLFQRRVRDIQTLMRRNLPSEIGIEDSEFIHTCQRWGNGVFVVTEKRLISYYGQGNIQVIKLEDAVGLKEPIFQTVHVSIWTGRMKTRMSLLIDTFNGDVMFCCMEGDSILNDQMYTIYKQLYENSQYALQLFDAKAVTLEMRLFRIDLKE